MSWPRCIMHGRMVLRGRGVTCLHRPFFEEFFELLGYQAYYEKTNSTLSVSIAFLPTCLLAFRRPAPPRLTHPFLTWQCSSSCFARYRFTYDRCPRALIFARDAQWTNTLADLKHLMQSAAAPCPHSCPLPRPPSLLHHPLSRDIPWSRGPLCPPTSHGPLPARAGRTAPMTRC